MPSFPPFVSNSVDKLFFSPRRCVVYLPYCSQRHVTRQKILNWKQSLRFPSRPSISHEGINLMQLLLCEPEDRLGSQSSASVSRPNSLIIQSRRSSFILGQGSGVSNDGADLIKVSCSSLSSDLLKYKNNSADTPIFQGHRLAQHPSVPRTLLPRTSQSRGYAAFRLGYSSRGV
jgi:hypothetical protein